jgi:glycerate 2-kinase
LTRLNTIPTANPVAKAKMTEASEGNAALFMIDEIQGRPRRALVIAPDKFKGSLSAQEAAEAIKAGVLDALPSADCILCPMADGGEGTVDAFLAHGATPHVVRVSGPLGERVNATFATQGVTAILEMASASGLELIARDQRNPTRTTTYGTGELISAALDAGAGRMIIGIGGSATNDAGVGMLRALGVRFVDADGKELGNDFLEYQRLAKIDVARLDRRLRRVVVEIAADVDNPLNGSHGAAYTFAAQKGASSGEIERLDRILRRVAVVSEETLGRDYSRDRGAGAAGGLGFALIAFLGARVERGVQLVARKVGLDDYLDRATLCLTGEGSIDEQTLHGKTVDGVAELSKEHNVPVIAFGGSIDAKTAEILNARGVKLVPIAPPGTTKEESMRNAAQLLRRAAQLSLASFSR